MTREELFEKLEDIEWDDFELKAASRRLPKTTWETVSAFSNTSGGWLVFGVTQTKEGYDITGVEYPEKIEQDLITTLRREKFNRKIHPIAQKYVCNGKTVLAFYIPMAETKPVYFNVQTNSFIRTGSGDQRATKEEIDAMYREQAFGTKDREPTAYRYEDLNRQTIESYKTFLKYNNPGHRYNQLNERQLLEKLHAIQDGHATVGGLLVFGKYDTIEDFLTDFRIDYLEIPGISYSDAEVRFSYRLSEEENLYHYFFSIMDRLVKKIELPFTLQSNGLATDNQPQLTAIREALVNLLMHSDYFSAMKPRIRVFTDRIEYMNPGRLPKDVEAIMLEDFTQPRNPVIARIFRVIKLAETAGSGFDKMYRGWQAQYHRLPEVISGVDYYKITFRFGGAATTWISHKQGF